MKSTLFNKLRGALLGLALLFAGQQAWAQAGQCLGGGCAGPGVSYGVAQSTTSGTFVNSVGCTYAGEFNLYNVTSGQQYEWSLCTADGATNPTADMQLTLKTTANGNICYSDDLCGATPKILWTATFTGQVRVLLNQYNCVTNSNCHTVVWRCVSCSPPPPGPCTNSTAFGSAAAPTNNTPVTISTCTYQSEYNTITSVVAGQTYSSSYNLGGWVTVRSGTFNGPVVAFGNSPLSWTATVSGNHFVHYTVNSTCAQAFTCGTSTITCTSCPPPPPPCNPPTGLITSATLTSVNFSWTAASPVPSNGYQWAVTTSATPPGSGTPTVLTSGSQGGLTPSTNYWLHVRSDCGTGFSSWASVNFFTGYCQPSSSSTAEWINDFITTGATVNISNTGTGHSSGPPTGYGNFTAQSVQHFAGGTINFTATTPNYPHAFRIWVDWNSDLDFDDVGEAVYLSAVNGLSHAGSFTIPGVQALGSYRMRIRSADATVGSLTPCGLFTWSEAEDYTLQVITPPTCGVPTGLTTNITSTTSVDVSWTAPGAGTVIGYEYAITTSPTAPGSGTFTAGTSVIGQPVSANTTYYLHVRTSCTSPTAFSPWVTSASFFTGYCTPTATFDPVPSGDFIQNVTTTGGITNINNTSGGGVPFGYQNFTAFSCSQAPGSAINFSVTTGGFNHNARIWVDWNNNLVFDAGELMFSSGAAAITHTGSFSVPGAQPLGSYRMRIRTVDGAQPLDPCNNVSWGEAEDYTFVVTPPPTCFAVSGLAATSTSVSTADISWNAPVLGNPPVDYFYIVSTNPSPVGLGTSTGGATSVTGVTTTPNVLNYLHVRTECAPGGDFSSWVTISFFSGYCVSTATTNNQTYFTNVNTTGGVTNLNNTSTFSTSPSGYQDFTAVTPTISQYPGEEFGIIFTMTGGTAGINVWVDWNNDLDFNDPGEFAVSSNGFLPSGTYGSVITVPAGQPIGQVRMRLRTDWLSGSPNACGNILFGETEDYIIDVVPLPACTAVTYASAYTTSTDLPLVCTGQTVGFTFAPAPPIASGLTYRLQYATAPGGPWSNVTTQSNPNFSQPSPAGGYYRIQILCNGSPISATWNAASVILSNPVITSTTPASRCGTGTLNLAAVATPAAATVAWYATASGGIPIGTGTSFTTPSISTTTSYYVQAENQVPTTAIGTGVTNNTTTGITPFSHLWENTKIYYLIRASELSAAGLVASDLTSLAFQVGSTGTFGSNNMTIRMAHTNALNVNGGFTTANFGFTTVFTAGGTILPAVGSYTFPLSGFSWNGTQNLLIEICQENDPGAG
jgi:hypothetical protein